MAKRRMCEDKLGSTSKAEVRLVGWGSSSLDESTSLSPQLRATATGGSSWPAHTLENQVTECDGLQLRERVAQVMSRNDRRKTPRLVQAAEIRMQQLSPTAGTPADAILGEVRNFSRGGVCIESPVPLMTSSVVQCQIGMPDPRVAIPTLMQVLWVEETNASEYAAGLRYLF
jgi:PilZ domain